MTRLDRLRNIDKGRVLEGLFGSPAPARRIGRFELLEKVGDGGMGVVYRARDTTLEREVAVKLLHAEATGIHRERLLREARALALLVHRNVIAVHDAGECDARLFIAMEFVRGRTLLEWQREPRSWRECLEVYAQAGRGLAAAHRVGIVHRDFKPANCILDDDGCVKVLDFGLARGIGELDDPELDRRLERIALGDEGLNTVPSDQLGTILLRLTRTGAILGTPAYMPPEQIAGRRPQARGDQFSFCVALYEAIYGQRPFLGSPGVAALTAETTPTFEPADSHRGTPRTPRWLRRALRRGLSMREDDRFASMDALLDLLEREPLRRRRRQRTAAFAAVLGLGGLWAFAPPPDPCAGRSAPALPELTAAARAALGTHTGLAERFLDDYGDEWLGARAHACEETRVGDASEKLLELRLRCLGRRVERAAALVRAIESGAPEILDDVSVTMPSLPSSASCLEAERPSGAGPFHEIELQLTADNYWSGAFDGVPFTAANAMEWRRRDTIVWFVASGRHTIAIDVVDVGTAAGFIAAVRVDGALVSATGDGSWRLADGSVPVRCAVSPVIAWAGSVFQYEGAAWIWDDSACSPFHTPSFALTLDL